MSKKRDKYHSEKDSPFYKMKSKAKLADLLFTSSDKIKDLASSVDLYKEFSKAKANGEPRRISAPRADLKIIQARIADLLQRIVPPDYLFAPVGGRSYVDNAARHRGAISVRLLDVEDFFPSCTANKVIWFFMTRMDCSPDVAALLRGLVTLNGSLPQGSPCSPILAYLCYVDMWDEIAALVKACGCTLSVYADDLTISGDVVPERLIWEVKQSLVRHGHKFKQSKERSRHKKPAEITGVILSGYHLLVPNRQHQKLFEARQQLSATTSKFHRVKIEAQVKGREAQFRQITSLA